MYFVCFPQNVQKLDSKLFSCQNRKSELSIDGSIISVPLLTHRENGKSFLWNKSKSLPERPFEFRLSNCFDKKFEVICVLIYKDFQNCSFNNQWCLLHNRKKYPEKRKTFFIFQNFPFFDDKKKDFLLPPETD